MSIDLLNFHLFFLIAFLGYCLGVFSHHILLYLYTKERSYLIFAIYVVAVFGGIIAITDGGEELVSDMPYDLLSFSTETVFLQCYHLALIFLTLCLNETKKYFPKLYRFSIGISLVVTFGLLFLLEGRAGYELASLSALIAFSLTLGITIYSIQHNVPNSYEYFLAIFPLLIAILIYILAINNIQDYQHASLVVLVADSWNIAFLSFVISKKIKELQEERDAIIKQKELDNIKLSMQSRNAMIGEVIADITHQWKQPLNVIANILNKLKATILFQGQISNKEILHSVDHSFEVIHHLSDTIDTFYKFLAQYSSSKEQFFIAKEFETIKKLIDYTLGSSSVKLHFSINANPILKGDSNEFIHAVLNILVNAKEALETNNVKNPFININLKIENKNCIITIIDNAGGIKVTPLELVFERYISTKSGGSGLGLHMANEIIVKHFNGKLNVKNNSLGACFTIVVPC
ncbi:ATP-binding protein [Sulfurimonas sp.]|uniref:ATP-binding protein n=1 Tax=Sulfurimonas sp. TaxID=2022749 RepID=UPI003D0B2BC9